MLYLFVIVLMNIYDYMWHNALSKMTHHGDACPDVKALEKEMAPWSVGHHRFGELRRSKALWVVSKWKQKKGADQTYCY